MTQPRTSAATTVPEEYADKDEENTSGSTNGNSSDSSSAQPSKIQFSINSIKPGDCVLTKMKIRR